MGLTVSRLIIDSVNSAKFLIHHNRQRANRNIARHLFVTKACPSDSNINILILLQLLFFSTSVNFVKTLLNN